MKIGQNIDKMLPSQLVLLNCVCIFDMEKVPNGTFFNVFEPVTNVSNENGFHDNLVTKQNE